MLTGKELSNRPFQVLVQELTNNGKQLFLTLLFILVSSTVAMSFWSTSEPVLGSSGLNLDAWNVTSFEQETKMKLPANVYIVLLRPVAV